VPFFGASRPARAITALVDRLTSPAAPASLIWRSLACLYLCAGVMSTAMLLSGLGDISHVSFLFALTGGTLLAGVLMFRMADAIPERWMVGALALGQVMISLAVLALGESDSPFTLIYVWVGVEAWFFLRGRQAVMITLGTVALSALVMLVLSPNAGDSHALTWWFAIVGSLVAMSGLAGVLHGRSVRLIEMLSDAAVRDPLTGLLNRRGYQERLEAELSRAERHGTELSIVLGDLDGFKILNDRHGHRHGDEALKRFAAICAEHLRGHDFVSRVGGEEFAIVLPQTPQQGAVLAAERLRRAVAEELAGPDGTPITASFGVATFPQDGISAEVLLDHADQAMYAAKTLGRDRTVTFAPDLDALRPASGPPEHREAVVLLAEALDLRDPATHAHSQTVAALCEQLANRLGLGCERVARLRLAGLLHDIGKIGVADSILRKPGALDDGEWAEMRKHPELGARILEGAGLDDIARWVLAHHERPDGTGYPLGLAGGEIPLEARILAIADAYEAMTCDRPYRAGMSPRAAAEELHRHAGTQFDAELVALFAGERVPALAA